MVEPIYRAKLPIEPFENRPLARGMLAVGVIVPMHRQEQSPIVAK